MDKTEKITAKIHKLGINPCIDVPEVVARRLLQNAGKTSGSIPVRGTLNGKKFLQTIVKYRGAWRLYLNTEMRKDAGIGVGDTAKVIIAFDPKPRTVPMNKKLAAALSKNKRARDAFEKLPPSHQKAILRYLNWLKTDEAVERGVKKVIEKELA